MRIKIKKSKGKGSISAPPSKSFAHRILISAALSNGKSVIKGISQSDDMNATLNCIKTLGVDYQVNGDEVIIFGKNLNFLDEAVYPCNESGSTLRFFIPLSLVFNKKSIFTGTERLIERGIDIYEEVFKNKNIEILKDKNSISLSGKLEAGEYSLRGDISSQFISGLFFALPLLEDNSTVKILPPVESRAYINITVDVLKTFGIEIFEKEENIFFIKGKQKYINKEIEVEGDWSNAAFLYALAKIGGDIEIKGLNMNSIQSDRACLEFFKELDSKKAKIDISNCPDLGPVLFAYAAIKNGGVFSGTKRLRIKESDRAQAMADELKKFGLNLIIKENSVTVPKVDLYQPKEVLYGHNDHRIVMALSVISTLFGAEIEGVEAVRKSFPNFFKELKNLNLEVEDGI